jgi:ribonuclease HI
MRPIWELHIAPIVKMRIFDSVVMPVLTYGDGSWSLNAGDLARLDVAVSRMRRVACGLGMRTSLRSVYASTYKASTLHRRDRQRHLGHLLRGGDKTCFAVAMLWEPVGRDRNRAHDKTPTELCALDMGMEAGAHLFDLAGDRGKWERLEEALMDRLEPVTACTLVSDTNWEKAWTNANNLTDLQFVEEGRTHKDRESALPVIHAYTDGSLITCGEGTGAGYAACMNGMNYHKIVVRPLVHDKDMTNNRAELMAALAACDAVESTGRPLVVHTDSLLVWNYFHAQRYKARMANHVGYSNSDLLRAFDRYIDRMRGRLYVRKVRSHNGNYNNDEVDAYAGMASQASFQMRHPTLRYMGTTPNIVGGPAVPVPCTRRAKEESCSYARAQQIRRRPLGDAAPIATRPQAHDERMPPVLGRSCAREEMTRWMVERDKGERVEIKWSYKEEPNNIFTSSGEIAGRGRSKCIVYDDWGELAFPPEHDVDVYGYGVVTPMQATPRFLLGEPPVP